MFTIQSIIYILKIQSYIMYAQARMRACASMHAFPYALIAEVAASTVNETSGKSYRIDVD
jgi:hypothetical protein